MAFFQWDPHISSYRFLLLERKNWITWTCGYLLFRLYYNINCIIHHLVFIRHLAIVNVLQSLSLRRCKMPSPTLHHSQDITFLKQVPQTP